MLINIETTEITHYWARSSAWLERSTDNRKAMSSNLIGPTFNYFIF